MENWLSHQDQKVLANDSEYSWCLVNRDVPQASALGLILFSVFNCELGNRTERNLRNFIKGFKSRKVVDNWRTGLPSRRTGTRWKNGATCSSLSSKKEKVLHLRQTNYMPGAGWLEKSFAEKDLKVLSSKLNMLAFLKAGKRPITYWAALVKA